METTIIITPIPAFYKVNLYNQIAKHKKIKVFFIGKSTIEQRSNDFISSNIKFDHLFLCNKKFQKRSIVSNTLTLILNLYKLKSNEILICGWDLIEFWAVIFLFKKKKLSLVLESTFHESTSIGFKGLLKKLFLIKIAKVYASGNNHIKLLENLNYKGIKVKTKGVGIINYNHKKKPLKRYQKKFIYVGRLARVKNLEILISIFNKLQDFELTIIGEGPFEKRLRKISNKNVKFLGKKENNDLSAFFSKNNFLILSSTSEPWGLVVEEALYNGLPIIISKNCGSVEIIENYENGLIFDPNNPSNLQNILQEIDENLYQKFKKNITKDFIEKKDKYQINCYL